MEPRYDLDLLSSSDLVRLIIATDRGAFDAVNRAADRIAQAVDAIADRMGHGARLVYVGAGTSGRLAAVDAAELPPTFGIDPDRVRVILAGGDAASARAIEGAEDQQEDAVAAIDSLVTSDDCVVGISASGTTPFTVAAIRRANLLGSLTIGITSVTISPLASECDIAIVVETGDEILQGSTRMKSGTAQKMVLHTLSTGVMTRLGHVYRDLMIDMPVTNVKLRERAIKMVRAAARVERTRAIEALGACGWTVRTAVVIARCGVSPAEAIAILETQTLREVLDT